MAAKIKALQQWCKQQCEGYRDVNITNFTSSWKSGLAFCAIIHRYRPDLIDYDSLSKDDTYGNSKLAFDTAQQIGIATLLDPEDMVIMTVPDKLCIITYVAQYYNFFHDKPKNGGPGVKGATKRPSQNDNTAKSSAPPEKRLSMSNKENPPQMATTEQPTKRGTMEDRCHMCHNKVYLLERHYAGGKLYHRHCIRETERTSTVKRNKENLGPANDKSRPASKMITEDNDRLKVKTNEHGLKNEPQTDKKQPSTNQLIQSVYNSAAYKSGVASGTPVGTSASASPAGSSTNQANNIYGASKSASSGADVMKNSSPVPFRFTNTPSNTKSTTNTPVYSGISKTTSSFAVSSGTSKTSTSSIFSSGTPKTNINPVVSTGIPKTTSNSVVSSGISKTTSNSVVPSGTPKTTSSSIFLSGASKTTSSSPASFEISRTTQNSSNTSTSYNLPKYSTPSISSNPVPSSVSNISISKYGASISSVSSFPSTGNAKGSPLLSRSSGTNATATVTARIADSNEYAIRTVEETRRANSSKPTTAVSRNTVHASRFDAARPSVGTTTNSKTNMSSNSVVTIPVIAKLPLSVTATKTSTSTSTSLVSTNAAARYSGIFSTVKTTSSTGLSKYSDNTASQRNSNNNVPSTTVAKTELSQLTVVISSSNTPSTIPTYVIGGQNSSVIFTVKCDPVRSAFVSSSGNTPESKTPPSVGGSKFESSVKSGGKNDDAMVSGILQSLASAKERRAKSDTISGNVCPPTTFYSPRSTSINVSSSSGLTTSSTGGGEGDIGVSPSHQRFISPRPMSSDKPEWQLEAERRQMARKKEGYIDPEKRPRSAFSNAVMAQSTSYSPILTNKFVNEVGPSSQSVIVLPPRKEIQINVNDRTNEQSRPESPPRVRYDPYGRPSSLGDRNEGTEEYVPSPVIDNNFKNETPKKISFVDLPTDNWKKVAQDGVFQHTLRPRVLDDDVELKPHLNISPLNSNEINNDGNITKRRIAAEERISLDDIAFHLEELDKNLVEVEIEGRNLEDKIRSATDDEMEMERQNDLMVLWFQLVKKRFELVREESEFIYQRRQQELEDFHEEVEYQLRYLLSIPDEEKTSSQKELEENLLKELDQIVRQRDGIVDSIEVDRKRYLEEDQRIDDLMKASAFDPKMSKKNKKNKKNKLHPGGGSKPKVKSFFRRSSKQKSPKLEAEDDDRKTTRF